MKHATRNTKYKIQSNRRRRMFHVSCFMFHNFRTSRENGMTLAFTLIIVSTILVIALAIGVFSFGQMRIFFSAKDSAYAIFAGTSGLEKALFRARVGTRDCSNFSDTMSTNLSYNVTIDSPSCGNSPTTISSIGTYRQTSRKIEASY